MSHLFALARAASTPTDEQVARVAGRVQDDVGDDPAVRLLAGVGGPDPRAVFRVERRLRRRQAARRVAPVVALAAVAAATLLAVWWPAAPRRVDTVLSSADRTTVRTSEDVALAYVGEGRARGTEASPTIEWERGILDVEVTPYAGVDLVVHTREADVRVVGTIFRVDRDALGTHVSVSRGQVEVDCHRGDRRVLSAGDGTTCLPVHPGDLLGRARRLLSGGAPDPEVLDAVSRGLDADGPAAVRGELLATRFRVYLDAGRTTDAADVARQYLHEGHVARVDEMQAFLEHEDQETP